MSRCPRCGFAKFKKVCPKCGAKIDECTDAVQSGDKRFYMSNIIVIVIVLLVLFLSFCDVPMRFFYAIGTWIASHGKNVIWM